MQHPEPLIFSRTGELRVTGFRRHLRNIFIKSHELLRLDPESHARIVPRAEGAEVSEIELVVSRSARKTVRAGMIVWYLTTPAYGGRKMEQIVVWERKSGWTEADPWTWFSEESRSEAGKPR